MMRDDDTKIVFHEPGTLSTWFKSLFRSASPAPPAPTAVPERRALIEARAREVARWDSERPSHDSRVEAARERVTQARALVVEAEAFLDQAEAERLGAALDSDNRVRQIDGQLRAGASGHIEIFLRDLGDQLEVLRAPGLLGVHESWGRRNPIDGQREHRVVSNADSIERRRKALMAAYRTAEAMMLEALDEATVIERLTALRDGIPAAELLTVPGPDLLTPAERREITWQLEQEAGR